jgi:SAM-dependent methyltransferase
VSVRGDGRREPAPSTLQYIRDPVIAGDYDYFNTNNKLFDFDTSLLDRLMPEPGSLVDLGCGTGRHVAHFARRGFEVTGLDLSEHMLTLASDRIKDQGLNVRFICRDIRDLSDLSDDSYDYVTCMFSTLGMVRGSETRRDIAEQVYRILRPGGRFFVHAHNRWHGWYQIDRIIWLVRSALAAVFTSDEMGDLWMESYRGIPNMYLHIFSVGEMRDLLGASGFKNVGITHLNEARDGELEGARFRDSRANGFIAVGTK